MAGKKGASSSGARAKTSNNHTNSKKQAKKTQNTLDEPDQKYTISDDERKHQQRVLDVFRHAFDDVLSSPSLPDTLQSVKQALYDRDFARAFGDPEHLAVYAARWSPTRALCYASVLGGIKEHLEPLLSPSTLKSEDQNGDEGPPENNPPHPRQHLKVLSIGGGAAELVAFGAFLNQQHSLSGSITLLDSGPWETVISALTTALTTPPRLSQYASAATKLSNTALIPRSHLTPTFLQQDALTLTKPHLSSLLSGGDGDTATILVTILFTLNELFTASGLGKTTSFLLDLTATIPSGSLLLVVDSPGSYSETSVGKDAKRYPMQWLLDRILLGGIDGGRRQGRRWVKVESRDSVWFRLAGGAGGAGGVLEYPIGLENMRYQMHLYRVEGDAGDDGDDD
ncbi:hypothetical protein C8A00DRAFT_42658 [Chaetomidium leptoderma]|uniref:25S rRNA (Uridine(2843)-N(3))-methyltransferase n=1 Tax=Chaetomidium leptoderma TaxID=669021 RepID=A0AAN6VQL3_9PEZI|nr:hypothetical protein C8A00DRAFT_42658 [Chaetomidium leptoderma]